MKKKKWLMITAALMSSVMSFSAFAIEWSRLGLYSTIREGKYYNCLQNEDGSWVTNEWRRFSDGFGANVWMYFGEDGWALTNTTTPDGYTVNERGLRYYYTPDAIVVDVDDYHYDNAYYPCSYDGHTVKNDYLGLALQYGEEEAASGYDLSVSDWQGVMSYSLFGISKDDVSVSLSMYPWSFEDESLEERIANNINFYKDESMGFHYDDVSAQSRVIGGQTFIGYQLIDTHKTGTDTSRAAASDSLSAYVSAASGLSGNSAKTQRITMSNNNSVSSDTAESNTSEEKTFTLYSLRLYRQSPLGGCLCIDAGASTYQEAEMMIQKTEEALTWLDGHITFSK